MPPLKLAFYQGLLLMAFNNLICVSVPSQISLVFKLYLILLMVFNKYICVSVPSQI